MASLRVGRIAPSFLALLALGLQACASRPQATVRSRLRHARPAASLADRVAAARVPCERHLHDPDDAESLAEALCDPATEVRLAAAESAACLGPDASPATWALIRAIRADEPTPLRLAALRALGAIGHDAAPALPAVEECLTDVDEGIRTAAGECVDAMRR